MRWSVILPISFLVLLLSCPCNSQKRCAPAFCGSVNVSYPFRLDSQPRRCGHHQLKEPLRCRNNRIVLSFPYANFVVLNITYNGDSLCGRIRMVDENLETDNCSVSEKKSVITPPSWLWRWISNKRMLLLNCTRDLKINSTASASIILVDAARCSSSSSHLYFAFRLDVQTPRPAEIDESCTIQALIPIPDDAVANFSALSTSHMIYSQLLSHGSDQWFSFGGLFCEQPSSTALQTFRIMADKLERVEAAGGRVINWNGNGVLGVLATSRSIDLSLLIMFSAPIPASRLCGPSPSMFRPRRRHLLFIGTS